MWIRRLAFAALDFFLPRLCVFCHEAVAGEAPAAVCFKCESRLQWIRSPLCPSCGRLFPVREGSDHLCGSCQKEPPPFVRARAAVVYEEEGPSGSAIKSLKYGRRLDMLPVMHHWLNSAPCRELAEEADLIAPVPLHPRRLQQRGFNQALLLAQAYTPAIVARELLVRVRYTPPQTTLKSPRERQENVKGAFGVPRPELVSGKRVLLVDDVYTTGATVKECARALRRAGAREVSIITVARVSFE